MPHSLKKMAQWVEALSSPEGQVTGFSFDSRCTKRGDLFFALDGQRVNGHAFLEEVARKGARGAVVLEEYQGPNHGLTLLKVPDVTAALQQAAKERLGELSCQVAAITGSVGKTTTKEFARQLLASTYRVHATKQSYNTQVGLPLTVLEAPDNCEILLLEMGMSEKGNMARLLEVAPPDVALLHAVEYVHAAFFDSLEEIAMEKGEILNHSITQVGLLCGDLPFIEDLMQMGTCLKSTYSTKGAADITVEIGDKSLTPIEWGVKQEVCPWNLPCRHNIDNFLAAAALCRKLDLSWEAIAATSGKLTLPKMRFETHEKRGVTLINDAYNACAASMCAAIDSLPKPKAGGKRIALLGGMLELGKERKAQHERVASHGKEKLDAALLIGEEWKGAEGEWGDRLLGRVETEEELMNLLERHVSPGDVLLVKGSRSYGLEKVVEAYMDH